MPISIVAAILSPYVALELAITLPDTNVVHATKLAERLRSKIEHISIKHNLGTIKFTIGIGISCFDEQAASSNLLVNNADAALYAALYAAKGAGRNKVKVFQAYKGSRYRRRRNCAISHAWWMESL